MEKFLKEFLKECRECWIAFVLVLFVAQAVQWKMQIYHRDLALPAILRLLDFTHLS